MTDKRRSAVFFDVGNTLLYPHPSVPRVCERVLASAGHARDLERISSLMPLVDDYYEGCYSEDDSFWTSDERAFEVWRGMYSLLCRQLDIPEPEASRLADRICAEFGHPDNWAAYDDVVPAMERLRGRGVAVGIISNWDTRLEAILSGLGLGRHVDTVVSSAAVGLHKPDPRIFSLACDRLGVEPSDCVHVGDHHQADVAGALAAGMTPVLIDRHGAGLGVEGVPCLLSLDQLEDALG